MPLLLPRAALLLYALASLAIAGAEPCGSSRAECAAGSAALARGPAAAVAQAAESDAESLGLLQRRSGRRTSWWKQLKQRMQESAPKQKKIPEELQAVLPITWVHVPKCGSSFVNTLIHLPGVCNEEIPDDLYVAWTTFGGHFLGNFSQRFRPNENCPGMAPNRFGHGGLGNESSEEFAEQAGHFMIFLRQPEQRLLSAYKDMLICPNSTGIDSIKTAGTSWGGWPGASLPDEAEYVSYARGCVVRMLTRGGEPCGGAGGPPSEYEVELAKQRLRNDFAFVGLTDEWPLSICLFDAMFKTGCHAHQFTDARPGKEKKLGGIGYDESDLGGVTDPYDGELFSEAKNIFRENLKRYNVNDETCQPCWLAAGLSVN